MDLIVSMPDFTVKVYYRRISLIPCKKPISSRWLQPFWP